MPNTTSTKDRSSLNTDSNNLSWSSATSESVNQIENGISRETQLQQTTDHPLNIDSNNLPSSRATSGSVNQIENGISRETQLQRTTDHPLNTDSNNLPWSSATSTSVNQTGKKNFSPNTTSTKDRSSFEH